MDWHPVISVQQQTPDNDFCHFSIANVRCLHFGHFFKNRKKARVWHRVKMMTRWPGDPGVKDDPKWPNDPAIQWLSSTSGVYIPNGIWTMTTHSFTAFLVVVTMCYIAYYLTNATTSTNWEVDRMTVQFTANDDTRNFIYRLLHCDIYWLWQYTFFLISLFKMRHVIFSLNEYVICYVMLCVVLN